VVSEPPLYLVRHAKAGSRSEWTEDDRLRPLSKKGRRQAEALVRAFRERTVTRVVSSPYIRCTQTVRPLALDLGVPLHEHEGLAEFGSAGDAFDVLRSSPGGTVLCSHGDMVLALLDHLVEQGVVNVETGGDSRKGSTWILERSWGRFVRARYVPPPLA